MFALVPEVKKGPKVWRVFHGKMRKELLHFVELRVMEIESRWTHHEDLLKIILALLLT